MTRRFIGRCIAATLVVACLSSCAGGGQTPGDWEEPAEGPGESEPLPSEPGRPIAADDFDADAILEGLAQVHAACMKVIERMGPPEPDGNYMPTLEDYRDMAREVGALGVPVAYMHVDMPNYQQVIDFCRSVQEGREDSLVLYCLHNTGPRAEAFYTRDGNVAVRIGYARFPLPDAEVDPPHVEGVYPLEGFSLTEKGFLTYANTDPEDGSVRWHRLYRVLPYDQELLALTDRFPLYFDRRYANLLDCNWDAEHLDDLHMLDIFEMLYNASHAEPLQIPGALVPYGDKEYHYALPAQLVEEVLQTHLPVTADYLRALPEYDADLQVYDWIREPRGGVSPVAEVVAARENDDGSLTLTIDAVGYETGNDREWTAVLTVREDADGNCRYLSCSTDFYDRYPYAYLQGQPVPSDPQEIAEIEDEDYRRLCRIISPYLYFQPLYDWEYPGDGEGLRSRMQYVLSLLENSAVEGSIPLDVFDDTGRHELPRREFDHCLLGVFADLALDDDDMIRQGLLNAEKTIYHIAPAERTFEGTAYWNWAEEQGDRLRFTVYCYQNEEEYLCQIDFLLDPRGEIPAMDQVDLHWIGGSPIRP